MHLPALLVAATLVAAPPLADLSARELSGQGATTDRGWLLEQARAQLASAAGDPRAALTLEETVRTAAQQAHVAAKRSRAPADYEHAIALYDLYLDGWPSGDAAYRFTWYRAQLLWDLGNYEQAALAYHATVRFDDAGPYRFSAARNEILAWERVVDVTDDEARLFAQRNLLEAADRYVLLTAGVKSPKVRAMRARAAFKAFGVLADHNVADQAKARAFDLLRLGPDAALFAGAAARILVEKTAEWHGEADARELACTLQREPGLRDDADTLSVLAERCPTR